MNVAIAAYELAYIQEPYFINLGVARAPNVSFAPAKDTVVELHRLVISLATVQIACLRCNADYHTRRCGITSNHVLFTNRQTCLVAVDDREVLDWLSALLP